MNLLRIAILLGGFLLTHETVGTVEYVLNVAVVVHMVQRINQAIDLIQELENILFIQGWVRVPLPELAEVVTIGPFEEDVSPVAVFACRNASCDMIVFELVEA